GIRISVARLFPRVLKAALPVMAVRAEDTGEATGAFGSEQGPRHVEAGETREIEVLDDIVAPVDRSRHHGTERAGIGRRPQSRGHELLLAKGPDPALPARSVRHRRESVALADLPQPNPGIGPDQDSSVGGRLRGAAGNENKEAEPLAHDYITRPQRE